MTENNLALIETDFDPVLHFITRRRPFNKARKTYTAVYFLGGIINADV
jgi:hypothetical protein